jgi:hypothetical protein
MERAAGLEAQLAGAREAFGEARTREAAALKDAGRSAGERDEARRQLDGAEARVRALEKEATERAAALATARATAEREAARAAAAERERDVLRGKAPAERAPEKAAPRPAP